MLTYSPKKKSAKPIAEYSTLYPETSSASASGKSKGGLFVSAKEDTKKSINKGKKGITNHKKAWCITISVKFKEEVTINKVIIINPIETS
tara:strand:+ start:16473 stop:16742 length:270 start_codon:yes stop_codon:yes gene_type:complete